MNLMELCLQGVPFLDGELIGAKIIVEGQSG